MRLRKKSSPASPNSPPPTPMSPIEYIRKGLAKLKAKDQKAPTASSSTVAPSVTHPSRDLTETTLDESAGSSRESVWKTASGMAKIALEITKESSDMFPPLKAVVGALSVLMKHYEQTTANSGQIKDIEEKIESFKERLASPVNDWDSEEKARREALRKKLARITAKLERLSEQHGIVKYLNNVDYASTLSGLVQDLNYAITDYQISVLQSIDRNVSEAKERELLGRLNPVVAADYRAGRLDTCLHGTRKSVLGEIMRWVRDPQDKRVFWLNGLAGTGKSTIARTFSETAEQNKFLVASFFCSRDYVNRKELKNIFPTLAYQLASRCPQFRSRVIQAIKNNLDIASSVPISQLKELIVDPLSSTGIPCVIVVDALDECMDNNSASEILSVLGCHVEHLPSVKFFITGRPEPPIRTGFRLLEPLTQTLPLHRVELPIVEEDIRLYLQEKLAEVRKGRSDLAIHDPWPCDQDLTVLTKKSSGLFIFASTLVKFIESSHHQPNERLQLIVNSPESTAHEGRGGIDPLYTQVLKNAFSNIEDTAMFENLRRVLGAVILAFNPLSRGQIAEILRIDGSLIATTLRHLHSLLLVPSEDSEEIRPLHRSLPDFLQNSNRCSDPRFFVDTPTHHGYMAFGCLGLLGKLKPNPCGLPAFVMNRDVAGLPKLLEDKVGGALRYACGHWAMHVRSSPTKGDKALIMITCITEFFENSVVPWIEVMSLENRLESVIYSIHHLFDWLGKGPSNLRSLAEDCLRFTMHFFYPIQQSARHIYHSALPLSPKLSRFLPKAFRRETAVTERGTAITEFIGRPETWGVVVRTIRGSSEEGFTCMTTFGGWIAAAHDDGTVGVYDSVTGALGIPLRPTCPVQAMRGSPDGSILFCIHPQPSMTVWDTRTGGLIHNLDLEWGVEDIAISLKGRYLAFRLSDGSVKTWEVATRTKRDLIESQPPVAHICWLEPEEQLLGASETLVHIWDIVTGNILRRFEMQDPVCGFVYSQKLEKLVIVTTGDETTIIITDPRSKAEGIDIIVDSLPESEATIAPTDHQSGAESAETTIDLHPETEDTLAFIDSESDIEFEGTITIMDPAGAVESTATVTDSYRVKRRLSCFAISETTREIVCGTKTDGLELFNISTWKRRQSLEHLTTITSLSTLSNGTIVANIAGSGIQFLSLDEPVHTPSQQQTTSALSVHALDRGNIIAVLPPTRDSVVLLRSATMLSLHKIPAQGGRIIPTDRPAVLCASLRNTMAVYCFEEGDKESLQLWRFRQEDPVWTASVDERPSLGGISPTGTRLVTYHNVEHRTHIRVWNIQSGQFQAHLLVDPSWPTGPLEIKFDSEDRFSSYHDTYRVPYVIPPSDSGTPSHSIIRHGQLPLVGQPKKRYGMEEGREWVVGFSKRICWVPLEYTRPDHHSYCWIGNTLVMAGQDSKLRMLRFGNYSEAGFNMRFVVRNS